jgi:hypothetical protein
MSRRYFCDSCGQWSEGREVPDDWYNVFNNAFGTADESEEWEFCSWKCILAFAEGEVVDSG